ncbi:MAG: peptidoglycan-binding protein [Archangiaceae bacterium]|nr:peptidoglycan-binding protein [Archangiaceae bacterium]
MSIPVDSSSGSTPVITTRTPDSIDRQAPAYRELPVNYRIGWNGKKWTEGGEKLKSLQNDLVHAGYYGNKSYKAEVDGLFGPQTQAAVTGLQQDLIAAHLYSGEASGTFDPATAQALAQMSRIDGLPEDLDAAAARRLSRFFSSSQADVKAKVELSDTFEPAKAPPPVVIDPGTDTGEQRINATVTALSQKVDMTAIAGADGQVSPEEFQLAIADLAAKMQAAPDSREQLAEIGQGQLGFDPMHNSEADVDNFLGQLHDQLVASSGGQQPAPEMTGEQRIDNMIRLLGGGVDMNALQAQGPVTPESFAAATAGVAEQIEAMPNSREFLAGIGAETLGFDPMKNSEQDVDAFLEGIRQQLLSSAGTSTAAPAPRGGRMVPVPV